MRALWFWCLASLAACGRTGFTPEDGPSSDVPGSDGAWQFLDSTSVESLGAPTVQLPLATASKGNELIVVAIYRDSGSSVISVTDNASAQGTYQTVSTAACNYYSRGISIWYGQGVNPGATMVTAIGTGTIYALVAWRFATPRTATLDVAGVIDDHTDSPTPTSPGIMTAAPGEIVVAAAAVDGAIIGIAANSEFTNDELPLSQGFAHLTDPHAPAGVHLAVWDQQPGYQYCASAAAFAVGP